MTLSTLVFWLVSTCFLITSILFFLSAGGVMFPDEYACKCISTVNDFPFQCPCHTTLVAGSIDGKAVCNSSYPLNVSLCASTLSIKISSGDVLPIGMNASEHFPRSSTALYVVASVSLFCFIILLSCRLYGYYKRQNSIPEPLLSRDNVNV